MEGSAVGEGSGKRRTSIDRRTATRAGIGIAAVVIVGAIVGPALLRGGPTPAPSQGVAEASPRGTAPAGTPGPTAIPEAWEALELPPAQTMATLTPIRSDRTGVDPASGFALVSRNGVAAAALGRGIVASPAIKFRIVPGKTADQATLQPAKPLDPGRTYRLRLTDPNGVLGGSWAFRTQHPLHVLYTLPDDRTTDVPVDSGIEVTFDQDGATGVEARFHVEPAVKGRFERHDRTWSFIPDAPLRTATAYTVTLDAGVSLIGASQVLEKPVTFRFETQATATSAEPEVDFGSTMTAIRPGQQPSFFVSVDGEKLAKLPDHLPVRIYRLPTLASAMAAAGTLTGPDSWLRLSGKGLVPTDGLTRVASVDAPVGYDDNYGTGVLSVAIRLDPGAYLVVVPGGLRPAQAILQVSDLSAYALASSTSTVVWVNDLGAVAPVAGAAVRTDGSVAGTTGDDGVATFPTAPYGPIDASGDGASPRLLSVRAADGRWLVAALGSQVSWLESTARDSSGYSTNPGAERWWLLLHTDRTEYRPSDTIHVSGLVRPRDGTAPKQVELRFRPSSDWDEDTDKPAISVVPVTLSRTGTFLTDIPFAQLPYAGYRVDLVVDGVVARQTWLNVADIRKPSFQIEVTTDRHAYLVGDEVKIGIHATFFDGTNVPHIELSVDGDKGQKRTVTTDANGRAATTVRAIQSHEDARGEWSGQYIQVVPVGPQEGDIAGSADVLVLPSNLWLDTRARFDGRSVVISGVASHVDFGAIDRATDAGGDAMGDAAAGKTWAGRSLTIRVIREHLVRTQVGTAYDFFEKQVVPVFHYDTVDLDVGTSTVTSRADGTFDLSMAVPSITDSYHIVVRGEDAGGRVARRDPYVQPRIRPADAERPVYLVPTGDCGFSDSLSVGLDAAAKVTLHEGDGRVASGGRFLFVVGRQGIAQVSTGTSAAFSRRLAAADLPGFTIRAIQVTSAGYVSADARVDVNLDDLQIDVKLTPTRERYAPGDHVRVKVTTLGPDGQPIAADVLVSGVDEKLYASGSAYDLDVLPELYTPISNGFLQSFASHRTPIRPFDGGCGDTGGGRESFADVVTSQLVHTGSDGQATVEFDVADDLTSWHLTAMAVSADMRAGRGSVLIPVSLPFFVDSVLAPEYLVGEHVILPMRAYGDALQASDDVQFTVSAPSLGLAETTVHGKAFTVAHATLPVLTAGTHRIRIAAKGPSGVEDAVIRQIRVVGTRLSTLKTTYDHLVAGYTPQGDGDGLTTYVVVDAGRGALLSMLTGMASERSSRFDRLAAADTARRILVEQYGFDADELPAPGFDPTAFQRSGIAALPYGGAEPELTALAALVVPERLDQEELRNYFMDLMSDATRETKLLAMTGLAAIGDDELASLQGFVDADLTVREQLWLGLGLLAAGDETTARTVERKLLATYGERFGPWVRLRVGGTLEDTSNAARLLLILSARLGEPFAPDVLRYLDDHESASYTTALERLAYVTSALDRLPREPGRFAWTVDGKRHVQELEPGASYELTLTAAQRAGLVLEPLDGDLEVVTSWASPGGPLPAGADVELTRSISPETGATEDRLVRVSFAVDFGPQAERGCWMIRELVPSGLIPVGGQWYGGSGQSLTWCKTPDDPDRTVSYVARVVTPGTYTWEPAVIQSETAPELGASIPAFTYTIGD